LFYKTFPDIRIAFYNINRNGTLSMINTISILIGRSILLIIVFWMIIQSSIAQRWGLMILASLSVYHLLPWQIWEWLTQKESFRKGDSQRLVVGVIIFVVTFALFFRRFL